MCIYSQGPARKKILKRAKENFEFVFSSLILKERVAHVANSLSKDIKTWESG